MGKFDKTYSTKFNRISSFDPIPKDDASNEIAYMKMQQFNSNVLKLRNNDELKKFVPETIEIIPVQIPSEESEELEQSYISLRHNLIYNEASMKEQSNPMKYTQNKISFNKSKWSHLMINKWT